MNAVVITTTICLLTTGVSSNAIINTDPSSTLLFDALSSNSSLIRNDESMDTTLEAKSRGDGQYTNNIPLTVQSRVYRMKRWAEIPLKDYAEENHNEYLEKQSSALLVFRGHCRYIRRHNHAMIINKIRKQLLKKVTLYSKIEHFSCTDKLRVNITYDSSLKITFISSIESLKGHTIVLMKTRFHFEKFIEKLQSPLIHSKSISDRFVSFPMVSARWKSNLLLVVLIGSATAALIVVLCTIGYQCHYYCCYDQDYNKDNVSCRSSRPNSLDIRLKYDQEDLPKFLQNKKLCRTTDVKSGRVPPEEFLPLKPDLVPDQEKSQSENDECEDSDNWSSDNLYDEAVITDSAVVNSNEADDKCDVTTPSLTRVTYDHKSYGFSYETDM